MFGAWVHPNVDFVGIREGREARRARRSRSNQPRDVDVRSLP